jgi:hypothetical protein
VKRILKLFRVLRKALFFLLLAAWLSPQARAQNAGRTDIDLSGSVEWEGGKITAALSLDLKSAGIRLPAGRIRGEEILLDEYPRILGPYILSLPADSSSAAGDYIRRNAPDPGASDSGAVDALNVLDRLLLEAGKTPPSLSADLRLMTGRYTLNLKDLASLLPRPLRRTEVPRPLIPSPAADYTGLIIIADGELPVHGKNSSALVRPCLFPKIRDSDMTEIYTRNMTDPSGPGGSAMVRYAGPAAIFRPTPSGLEGDLAELAGPNPLRIFARGVFGAYPTDPIIDKEDALKIISRENNRRLLREGRVIFILNENTLKNPLQ